MDHKTPITEPDPVPDELWLLILFTLLFALSMTLFLANGCQMGNLYL